MALKYRNHQLYRNSSTYQGISVVWTKSSSKNVVWTAENKSAVSWTKQNSVSPSWHS